MVIMGAMNERYIAEFICVYIEYTYISYNYM